MALGPIMVDLGGVAVEPAERDLLSHPLVGGVILFARNFEHREQLCRLVAEIKAARSPALLVAVDQEGGRVQRFREGFQRLPPLRALGRQYDLDRSTGLAMARDLGWLMASELVACGIDLSFAPCIDLDFGVSGVIGDRAFHRNPVVVAELAISYLRGMADAGMSGTAKHYPGHGAVRPDSHHELPIDQRPLEDLDEELGTYRRLIANGLRSVMAAHVLFPEVDSLPPSLSRRWIEGELRGRLDFRGAVFTDDLCMQGAASFGSIVERARLALAAGCDMLPVCNDRAAVEQVLSALEPAAAPVSQLRLSRLHGRAPADAVDPVRWERACAAASRCFEAPPLRLES